MRSKKVWRYYCDYCKKSGCSKYHLRNHEESCTMNPNRICNLHGEYIKTEQPKLGDLIKIVNDHLKNYTYTSSTIDSLLEFDVCSHLDDELSKEIIGDLMDASDCCPICTLAAIRQRTRQELFVEFNFKKAMDEFWAEWREEENRQTQHDAMYG